MADKKVQLYSADKQNKLFPKTLVSIVDGLPEELDKKINKVENPTAGDLVSVTSQGSLVDLGIPGENLVFSGDGELSPEYLLDADRLQGHDSSYFQQKLKAGDNITLTPESDGVRIDATGGGTGTSDYTKLTNKPKINGFELTGDKSAADLSLIKSTTVKEIIVLDRSEYEALPTPRPSTTLYIIRG